MGNYIEEYDIAGLELGIEDYESPGSHFMPGEPHGRFKTWVNGGSLGDSKTLNSARFKAHEYAMERLNHEFMLHRIRCRDIEDALFQLYIHPTHDLTVFRKGDKNDS